MARAAANVSDAAGVARSAANVSRLQLAMRIPKRNLRRTDTEYLLVKDMCALSADEVLLACGDAGLRAVSLHTAQLAAHESSAIRDYVRGVAFDAHNDTLLLLVLEPTGNYYQLVSLRRNASKWLEVQRLDTRIRRSLYIAVCDSRVLLGGEGWDTLYVFDVSSESTLRDAGSVTIQSRFYGIACTRRDGVTLVAFSNDTSVSLLRLTSLPLRLVPLASVSLTDPHRLLFREDLLLVADLNRANRTDAIVSFRVSGNALTERRVLLDAQAGVRVEAWTLASDRLVLRDLKSEELLVYDFT